MSLSLRHLHHTLLHDVHIAGAMLEAGCGMLDRQQEWEKQRKRRLSQIEAARKEEVCIPSVVIVYLMRNVNIWDSRVIIT